GDLAISRNGRELVVTERQESLNLTRLPLATGGGAPAGSEEQLNPGEVRDHYPSFSPDGRRIAFGDNRLRNEEVWILDLATRHRNRLRSEEHTSELQSRGHLVCRLLLEKKKNIS